MKRRNFLRVTVVGSAVVSVLACGTTPVLFSSRKQVYELREYELVAPERQELLDRYFQYGLIPALNRDGISDVGAFKEIEADNPAKVYLLIPYPSGKKFFQMEERLSKDKAYVEHLKIYDGIPVEDRVFSRYKIHLLEAFDAIPMLEKPIPATEDRVFEYRTYESYSEDAGRRKIEMFNREELELFRQIGLSPVFFGKVLAGDVIPGLSYMLCFHNMQEMEEKWERFRSSKEWGEMKDKPEYNNTVSKVVKRFLKPLYYSQI